MLVHCLVAMLLLVPVWMRIRYSMIACALEDSIIGMCPTLNIAMLALFLPLACVCTANKCSSESKDLPPGSLCTDPVLA